MTPAKPLRVLIVEDEGLIAMDIEDTIEDQGHSIVGWAVSAEKAIAVFDKTQPDLTLLDIELLNGSSGLDVARYLQAMGDRKYLFLTANPAWLDEDFLGAIGVLSKPFTRAKLMSLMQYLHEGLLDPPPSSGRPDGLTLGPDYETVWV